MGGLRTFEQLTAGVTQFPESSFLIPESNRSVPQANKNEKSNELARTY